MHTPENLSVYVYHIIFVSKLKPSWEVISKVKPSGSVLPQKRRFQETYVGVVLGHTDRVLLPDFDRRPSLSCIEEYFDKALIILGHL